MSDTKSCLIQNSRISNCGLSAVEAYNNSKVTIKNSTISKSGINAFRAIFGGTINAEKNTIRKGGGEFINNRISNCQRQNELILIEKVKI
mgnify:CR=1 FL=1